MIYQITVDSNNIVTGTFISPDKYPDTIEVTEDILNQIAAINGRCTYINGVVTALPPTAAEIDADKDRQLSEADLVSLKIIFNHENRHRTLVRGLRAALTAGQNTTLNNQGVEVSRPNLTWADFITVVKTLL